MKRMSIAAVVMAVTLLVARAHTAPDPDNAVPYAWAEWAALANARASSADPLHLDAREALAFQRLKSVFRTFEKKQDAFYRGGR